MFATVAGAARCGKALRRLVRRSSKSEGGRNPCLHRPHHGLLRGACHRARVRATRWLAMTMWRQWARQNNPTGKSPKVCPSLSRKNISLFPKGESGNIISSRPPKRGGSAIVTNVGRGCSGREGATDERGLSVRQRRVVLTSRCWRQRTGGTASRDDGGKRAVLRGEHDISRKAIAQGRPDALRWTCMLVCAFFVHIAHETAGAARTRSSLRPLYSRGKFEQTSGAMRREIAVISSSSVTVRTPDP